MRRRTVVVLLLLAWPAAGAVGWAVFSGKENATSAAGGQSGTGTVVGGNRSASPSPAPNGPAGPGRPAEGEFSITGHVAGLVPGVPTRLPLTITNPNPWPIRVLSVDVGVGTPAGAACPAGTLRVADYTGPVVARPRATVVVTVPVELADSPTQDQSGCPDTTFPLSFTGTAERV